MHGESYCARAESRDRSSSLGPVSLWDLLGRLTPELSEWARHFAVITRRMPLVESGRIRVSVREADDLLALNSSAISGEG